MVFESGIGKGTAGGLERPGAPVLLGARFHVLFIIFIGLAAYSNTFEAPFVFDDKPNIVENFRIRDIFNIPSMFVSIEGPLAHRPVALASLALDFNLWGLNTTGYHLSNVAVHLLNGLLLYRLIAMTGELKGFSAGGVRFTAFFSALLFVAHPLQTESVTYIVTRSMLLAAMFYFAGIILFVKAVKAGKSRPLYASALFAVSLMGMASREDFATFPLVLLFYDYTFVSGLSARKVKRHLKVHLAALAPLAYLAFLVANFEYKSAGFGVASIAPWEYLLTQSNVLWTYIRLLLLPINQNLDYGYPVAKTLFEVPTLVSCLGYIGLWGLALYLARRRPIASFAMFWFLITLLPASSVVPLGDVIFEHRLYLPSVGAVAGVVAFAYHSASRARPAAAFFKRALAPVLLGVVCLFATLAYARNSFWGDDFVLWSDAARKSPSKARPHNNLGLAYLKKGMADNAREHFLKALMLDPFFFQAHNNVATIYMGEGNTGQALEHLLMAMIISPDYMGHFNLGNLYMGMGENERALGHFEDSVRLNPVFVEARNNLGNAYLNLKQWDDAINCFNGSLEIDKGFVTAYYNLGVANLGKGDFSSALRYVRTYVMARPMDADGWYSLGKASRALGDPVNAVSYYRLALKLNPAHRAARDELSATEVSGGAE